MGKTKKKIIIKGQQNQSNPTKLIDVGRIAKRTSNNVTKSLIKNAGKQNKRKLKKNLSHLKKNECKSDSIGKSNNETVLGKNMKPLLDALPSLNTILQMKNLRTGVPAFDNAKSKNELKKENKLQRFNDFQEKLVRHKDLFANFSNLSSSERRAAILEAQRKKISNQE